MFSNDTERVIPRQRINLANLFSQGITLLFVILIFVQLFLRAELPEWLEPSQPLILVALVVFFILTGLMSAVVRWNQTRRWKRLAEELGFQTEQKTAFSIPRIRGTYRGYRVAIADSTEKQGRSNIHYTNFMLELNTPSQSSFTIEKRSLTHMRRELTNDDEIDKKLTVKISSEHLLQQILRSRRLRQGLLELGDRAQTKSLYMDGKTLHYKERGQISDREYMQAVLGYIIELAKLIEREVHIGF